LYFYELHQAGAKYGYIGDNKALDELDNQRTKAIELADKAYVEYMRNPTDEIYARYEELNKQAAVLTTKLNRMKRDSDLKVPDGPFKKTWPELAMRRMIRYAAENGMIGWHGYVGRMRIGRWVGVVAGSTTAILSIRRIIY
jgi:hypothetical protein